MNLKTAIDLYPLDADRATDPPRSAPLAAFLEHFGPARGYAVETEIVDALSLQPGLRRLYALVLHTGRTPADAGLPAPALADPTLVCRATLRDASGRVLATATAARAILADQDVEILETAARRRLAAALGFGEEVLPPIPGEPGANPVGAVAPAEPAPLAASPSTEAARQTLPPPAAASNPDADEPAAAADTAPPGREPVAPPAPSPVAPPAPGAPLPDDAAALALLRRQLAHLAKTRGVEPPAVATKAEAHAAIKTLLRPAAA